MYTAAEYEPNEVFECDDYIYAREGDGWSYGMIICEETGVRPPARLLDVGCGLGTLTRSFKSFGYEAYGVESRDVVPADGVTLFREDARRMHFPDNFFDIVVDRLATSQLIGINKRPDVAADILKEIGRVIRPGGFLISRTGTSDLIKVGIEQWADGPKKMEDLGGFLRIYQFR